MKPQFVIAALALGGILTVPVYAQIEDRDRLETMRRQWARLVGLNRGHVSEVWHGHRSLGQRRCVLWPASSIRASSEPDVNRVVLAFDRSSGNGRRARCGPQGQVSLREAPHVARLPGSSAN